MRLPGGTHLGYCTNCHVSLDGDPAALLRSLTLVSARVRATLEVAQLGLGLYLGAGVARELTRMGSGSLREALERMGLYAFTLNGFPYGDFFAKRVKEAVYRPDWTDPARLAYTLDLAHSLCDLAPAPVTSPTISTVPLGWRRGWTAEREAAAARALVTCARSLADLAHVRGRQVRVCLEPEPGCALESTVDVVRFFSEVLDRAAGADRDLVRAHVEVCYDTCHQAVQFEAPGEVLGTLARVGIGVGKVQLSSALELTTPSDELARAELAVFDEARYLHQVRARDAGGTDDLPEGIATLPRDRPWRVHFHVPIDRERYGRLATTRGDLEAALDCVKAAGRPVQLEVETYTFAVLPERERPADEAELAKRIAREVAWVKGRWS
jgi:sugar phosphate isomerase/epimerase